MTPPELIAYVNTQPDLLSLLYDMDLMPEQVDERESITMGCVIEGYALGAATEREACAKIAESYHDDGDNIATDIRART